MVNHLYRGATRGDAAVFARPGNRIEDERKEDETSGTDLTKLNDILIIIRHIRIQVLDTSNLLKYA